MILLRELPPFFDSGIRVLILLLSGRMGTNFGVRPPLATLFSIPCFTAWFIMKSHSSSERKSGISSMQHIKRGRNKNTSIGSLVC